MQAALGQGGHGCATEIPQSTREGPSLSDSPEFRQLPQHRPWGRGRLSQKSQAVSGPNDQEICYLPSSGTIPVGSPSWFPTFTPKLCTRQS